jgi:hypothetical protein
MNATRIWSVGLAVLLLSAVLALPGDVQAGFLDSVGDALKKTGKDISKGVKQVGEEVGIVDKEKAPKAPAEKKEAAESADPSASDALPGGVKSRLKKLTAEVNKGRKALRKGAGSQADRARRAESHLKRAMGYQAEIEKKYAGQYAQDHPDVKKATEKLEALAVDIEIALLEADGTPATAAAPAPEPEPATPTAKKAAVPAPAKKAAAAKLPGGVTHRLKKMQKELDTAEKALAKGAGSGADRSNRAGLHLKRARGYQAEIEKKYAGQFPADHPEVSAVFGRLAELETEVASAGQAAAAADASRKEAEAAEAAVAAQAAADREAAQKAQKDQAAAASKKAQGDCDSWENRLKAYTEGDKAMYACVGASDEKMPDCKAIYDASTALLDEYRGSAMAAEPCSDVEYAVSDLERYRKNFEPVYARYVKKQAAAKANLGEIVFSTSPLNPDNPSKLTRRFKAGDRIYGLIRTTKPWSDIYKNKKSASIRVDVKLNGKKIHAQFVKLNDPELMQRQYLVFDVAPDPKKMTAYSNPDIVYGKSTATMRQGPNELTHHLGKLSPGSHTMAFELQHYGTVWAAGDFVVEGKKFKKYAKLHAKIAEGVAQSVTLPPAKMVNKKMAAEMKALLENAGWSKIHRINIVDKDWWLNRTSGGNSPIKSRHLAAAALAKGDDGKYFYKICTFHQDRLITGGFGKLYLSHQGDKVPIPKKNIDK